MCDIRSKITRYAKKQQNETHYKHKNQSTETDLGHTKEAHIQRTPAPLPQAPAELLFLPRWAL